MANSNVEPGEVPISVDTIKSLVNLVKEQRNRHNQKPSIFMVPRIYRDQNPSCFDPKVVSLGPLHRGHKNVQENEGLKGAYMHDLLARVESQSSPQQTVEQTLESCFLKVNSYISAIKVCYGGMNNYKDFDVTKMMVTDACFILEFLQKNLDGDPFLCSGNNFTMAGIFTDLLLIENQIPFFVLQDIFDLTLKKIQENNSLITLLHHVLFFYKPLDIELKIVNDGNFKHILEILHISCLPDLPLKYVSNVNQLSHSVVELDRAGVKLKPNQSKNMEMAVEYESYESFGWLRNFLFFKKPTLRMPVFIVNDNTELRLRNLIAFEQSYLSDDNHYFTSFAIAMDMFVDSKEDVVKLVESKVIINYLGSNEDAANMINSIANDVSYSTFLYKREFKELNKYCKSYWPKHMARLKRTYFNSPWNAIALIVGILLFALTAIQTIFTVMSA